MEGMLLGLGLEMEPQPAVTTEAEAPKQEEAKPPAAPDLSEFDRDELPDDYQPKN